MPQRKEFISEEFEVKDKAEEDVHFDLVLTQDNLLEFGERKLIHPKADEVCEYGEEGAIIFAVGTCREAVEDEIVGGLEEAPVPLGAVEDLLHEDTFGVLALEL